MVSADGHVSRFTGGQGNLEFVNSVPSKAKRPDGLVFSNDRDKNILPSTNLLQLLFPAGSINPGTKPQGGAEFYTSPIDIASARNVTLQYSVFFPLGFDFVLGGKMPGLYGGHTGGDPAMDCFSTRFMWREDGIGELYLVSFCRIFDEEVLISLRRTLRKTNNQTNSARLRALSVMRCTVFQSGGDPFPGKEVTGQRLGRLSPSTHQESKTAASHSMWVVRGRLVEVISYTVMTCGKAVGKERASKRK